MSDYDIFTLNEDWLRTRSLDLYIDDHPVSNLDDLARAIYPMTLEEFRKLPAAEAVPYEWWDDEEIEKAVRRVKTPAGARKYGQPIGSIIRPDFVNLGRRVAAGQAAFREGDKRNIPREIPTYLARTNGTPMSHSEAGDTFEVMVAEKAAAKVGKFFGVRGIMVRESGAERGARNIPIDLYVGNVRRPGWHYALEHKAISVGSKEYKVCIRVDSKEKKIEAAKETGALLGTMVTLVDQEKRLVRVYLAEDLLNMRVGSKRQGPKPPLFTFRYTNAEFEFAHATAGYAPEGGLSPVTRLKPKRVRKAHVPGTPNGTTVDALGQPIEPGDLLLSWDGDYNLSVRFAGEVDSRNMFEKVQQYYEELSGKVPDPSRIEEIIEQATEVR